MPEIPPLAPPVITASTSHAATSDTNQSGNGSDTIVNNVSVPTSATSACRFSFEEFALDRVRIAKMIDRFGELTAQYMKSSDAAAGLFQAPCPSLQPLQLSLSRRTDSDSPLARRGPVQPPRHTAAIEPYVDDPPKKKKKTSAMSKSTQMRTSNRP
ncbi:hypothetical protein MYU51_001671 [Penicillium brevicompactum]|uniref:uncharacterized protein n=1 Tax=Penicillium brevicompactum TaxID=5074 RepID=UPI0025416D91|nr:uncharacterized protein N7506_009893 [Penicillium brevicompactum]KAJ5326791.1 hypothetical protein N7506_009893 [Penicillium brevicompactum]